MATSPKLSPKPQLILYLAARRIFLGCAWLPPQTWDQDQRRQPCLSLAWHWLWQWSQCLVVLKPTFVSQDASHAALTDKVQSTPVICQSQSSDSSACSICSWGQPATLPVPCHCSVLQPGATFGQPSQVLATRPARSLLSSSPFRSCPDRMLPVSLPSATSIVFWSQTP